MADELDRRLEATLQRVLRDEAGAIPFTLRLAALQRVRSERARTRRAQRWSLAAAAVALLVVGGGVAALLARPGPVAPASPSPPAPSPSDGLSGLPSFERLAGAGTGGGGVLMQHEGVAAPQVQQWRFALPRGAYAYQYLVACSGAYLDIRLAAESLPTSDLGPVICDGGVWRLEWTDPTNEQAVLGSASVSVVVQAVENGTAWRMVVAQDGSGRIVQRFAGSPLLFRMPSLDWMAQHGPAGAVELARASGLNTGSETSMSTLRGIGSASAIEVSVFCVGSAPRVWVAADAGAAAAELTSQWPWGCFGSDHQSFWQRTEATRAVSEVRLGVPPGTAWEAIVWDLSSAPDALPSPAAALNP